MNKNVPKLFRIKKKRLSPNVTGKVGPVEVFITGPKLASGSLLASSPDESVRAKVVTI